MLTTSPLDLADGEVKPKREARWGLQPFLPRQRTCPEIHHPPCHGSAGGGIKGQPAAHEGGDSGNRVVLHQAGGGDVGSDVHRMGEKHGGGAGEGFGHGDAEVFQVGGEHESISGLESAPLLIALEHAGPVEVGADAQSLGQVLELGGVGAAGRPHQHHGGRIPEALGLEGSDARRSRSGPFLGATRPRSAWRSCGLDRGCPWCRNSPPQLSGKTAAKAFCAVS
jgi:hypothetical protein